MCQSVSSSPTRAGPRTLFWPRKWADSFAHFVGHLTRWLQIREAQMQQRKLEHQITLNRPQLSLMSAPVVVTVHCRAGLSAAVTAACDQPTGCVSLPNSSGCVFQINAFALGPRLSCSWSSSSSRVGAKVKLSIQILLSSCGLMYLVLWLHFNMDPSLSSERVRAKAQLATRPPELSRKRNYLRRNRQLATSPGAICSLGRPLIQFSPVQFNSFIHSSSNSNPKRERVELHQKQAKVSHLMSSLERTR